MSKLEVAISFPALADFGSLYQRDIAKGGVFVETPGDPPALDSAITVVFRVDGVNGELKLHGKVVQVLDGKESEASGRLPGVGVQLLALDPGTRASIQSVLDGSASEWPEVADPEVMRLVAELTRRIDNTASREIINDLGLSDDPTVEEVEAAYSDFIRRFHPDRFAPLGSDKLKELSNKLFSLTKKAMDKIRKQAERSEKMRESVKEKVAQQAAVEPSKVGTTNPLQQAAVSKGGTGSRPVPQTGSRPVPRPGTRPVPRPGTGPQARSGTGPQARTGTGPQTRPATRPGTQPVPRPGTQPVPRPGTGPVSKPRTRAGLGGRGSRVDPMKEAARGRMALRRKDYKVAVNHFARAVLADPDSSEYLALLGRATFLADNDKHEEAQKLLDKAAKLDNDNEWAFVYMGQMAKMLGNDKRAIEHFRAALRINPQNSEARLEVRLHERRVKAKSPVASGPSSAKKDKSLLGGLFGRGKKK